MLIYDVNIPFSFTIHMFRSELIYCKRKSKILLILKIKIKTEYFLLSEFNFYILKELEFSLYSLAEFHKK